MQKPEKLIFEDARDEHRAKGFMTWQRNTSYVLKITNKLI